ncbi:MAG TPA: imidazole glycerol phosphate synthase subunit HisH, partial [Acidimicrobiia bacterium]|nr:imidazole glycerol phosphate synthase subunit HisH [Acidimicrobiia bacterium]
IDHGAGNLVSIGQGLAAAGALVDVVDTPGGLAGADGIVLPGVGSAAAAFDRLDEAGFVGPLRETTLPLLGICVGLQLLFDGSEEDDAGGLGRIPGHVRRLQNTPRLPHIGWNDVAIRRPDPLLARVPDREVFYFVHSFAPVADDPADIVATSTYGEPFVAAARRGTAIGVQFHPERSGPAGLRILADFVGTCREDADAA